MHKLFGKLIVVINGPSSSGKTTLAQNLKSRLGIGTVVVQLDAFYPWFHRDEPNGWEQFEALTRLVFSNARTLADLGYCVIVDTVFERSECFRIGQEALHAKSVCYVGLTSQPEDLRQREAQRNNRPIGLAEEQSLRVHEGIPYDVELCTSALSPEETVDSVIKAMRHIKKVRT